MKRFLAAGLMLAVALCVSTSVASAGHMYQYKWVNVTWAGSTVATDSSAYYLKLGSTTTAPKSSRPVALPLGAIFAPVDSMPIVVQFTASGSITSGDTIYAAVDACTDGSNANAAQGIAANCIASLASQYFTINVVPGALTATSNVMSAQKPNSVHQVAYLRGAKSIIVKVWNCEAGTTGNRTLIARVGFPVVVGQ